METVGADVYAAALWSCDTEERGGRRWKNPGGWGFKIGWVSWGSCDKSLQTKELGQLGVFP